MSIKDYYAILGVDRFATEQEIKTAYRQLAKKYHPDYQTEGQKQLTNVQFDEINEAYHTLIDRKKRSEYDCILRDKTGTLAPEKTLQMNQAETSYGHGIEALKRAEYRRAIEYFRAAIKFNPQKAMFYNRLGLALGMIGKYKEAETYCEQAIKLEMFNPQHYLTLGLIYEKAKALDKAKIQFQEALKWDPQNRQAKEKLQILGAKKGFFSRFLGGE
ncbi:MAG: DnaJ domain-containing protein [Candidatus Edwardsbacteria bacterium]